MRNRFFSFLTWVTPGWIAALIFCLTATLPFIHFSDELYSIARMLCMGSLPLGIMGFFYSYKFFNLKNSVLRLIGIYAINVFGAYVLFYLLFFHEFILDWFSTEDFNSAITSLIGHFLFGFLFFFPLLMFSGILSILILYFKNRKKSSATYITEQ